MLYDKLIIPLVQRKVNKKSAPPCKKAERFMTMIIQKAGYSSNLPTIRLAFWPPKPRALFMAMRTSALRAVLGTQSRSQSGSGVS